MIPGVIIHRVYWTVGRSFQNSYFRNKETSGAMTIFQKETIEAQFHDCQGTKFVQELSFSQANQYYF